MILQSFHLLEDRNPPGLILRDAVPLGLQTRLQGFERLEIDGEILGQILAYALLVLLDSLVLKGELLLEPCQLLPHESGRRILMALPQLRRVPYEQFGEPVCNLCDLQPVSSLEPDVESILALHQDSYPFLHVL